jgi:hypothetical protein
MTTVAVTDIRIRHMFLTPFPHSSLTYADERRQEKGFFGNERGRWMLVRWSVFSEPPLVPPSALWTGEVAEPARSEGETMMIH